MKARELRSGNYYQDQNGNVEKLVTFEVEFGKIEYPDGFQPIPLTEEWLQKFGFIGNSKTIGNFYISVTLGENDIYINDGYGYEGAYIPLKCEHVHTLQNLYFALTGEELTLSE